MGLVGLSYGLVRAVVRPGTERGRRAAVGGAGWAAFVPRPPEGLRLVVRPEAPEARPARLRRPPDGPLWFDLCPREHIAGVPVHQRIHVDAAGPQERRGCAP